MRIGVVPVGAVFCHQQTTGDTKMDLDIESVVKKAVALEMHEIDAPQMARELMRELIRNEVGKVLPELVKNEAASMIQQEIHSFLDGPVNTDDGWGKKETYPSFEDLFKKQFRESMNSTYEVKREIEKQVKARVDALVKQDFSQVIEKIVDQLTCSKPIKK